MPTDGSPAREGGLATRARRAHWSGSSLEVQQPRLRQAWGALGFPLAETDR